MSNTFDLLSFGIKINKKKEENKNGFEKLYNKVINEEFLIKTIDEFKLNLNIKNNNKEYNLHKEIIKKFIHENNIKFEGKNIKTPTFSYEKMNKIYDLDQQIIDYLINEINFGFPSIIQSIVFPNLLDNNGIFISPTGSGKTLAYLLPIMNYFIKNLNEKKITIFVLPVYELVNQLHSVLNNFLKYFKKENNLMLLNYNSKNLENYDNINFIITTPKNLIENTFIPFNRVNRVVLDEFDRFFELNFIDDIIKIFNILENQNVYYNLFSATLPLKVEELINKYLIDKIKIIVSGQVKTINNVKQELIYCSSEEAKIIEIENLINDKKFHVPCLIFVENKARTYHLFKLIKNMNISATFINSDLTKIQRKKRIEKFNNQKVLVLISTDVLGRGIDLNEINMVINFDIPLSTIDYIHRVGRTGRFGNKGKSITLFTNNDKQMARKIAYILKNSGIEVYDWLLNIKKEKNNKSKKIKRDKII